MQAGQGDKPGVIFRSVWQTNPEALDLYRCIPSGGWRRLACGGNLGDSALRNVELLDKAFKILNMAATKRGPFRLIVPVNAGCLVRSEMAAKIVHEIKKLEPTFRRAVIFEVFGFPQKISLDFLDEATIPLMPFFDDYIAAAPPDMGDFTVFTNCNYLGVSVSMEDLPRDGGDGRDALDEFCSKAEMRRLKVYVHGVKTKEQAEMARSLAVEGIDGECYGGELKNLNEKIKITDFN